MNEGTHSTHAMRGLKRAEFPEPDDTVVAMPEVEDIRPVSVETIPYRAFRQPMVAPTELFVKKHDFGLFHFYKVPPNTALVISGPFGTRVVTGRSTFVFPTEIANEINLEVIAVPVFERDIRTKSIFSVDIEAVVHFKVMEDPESMKRAAQVLLSRSNEQVANMIQEIVNAHIRQICATMSIDDLQDQMEQFNARVVEVAQPNFEKLGFTIKVFVLKQIIDREGYFLAKAAETKAQLLIRQAEAKKQADMRTADLRLEGEGRKSEVQALLEGIWKDPIVAKYRSEQEIEMEKARREMVAPIESERLRITLADQQKRVKQLHAEAEAIRIKEIGGAEASASRMTGEAEAAVKTAMIRIFQGLDQGNLGLRLADRLPAILAEIATAVKNVDVKWAHVGGQPTASDPIGKTIQNILFSMIPIFQLFGLELKGLLGGKKSGEKVEEVIKKFWSSLSPENQKSILEKVVSNLDKDLLKEIFQK